ncbi:MAG TPA: fumarate reductase subunit FrdD [Methylomirabilota bacterium]|nr:fumarate reductase subunit FrdD [Methylomirabilota bacterium]
MPKSLTPLLWFLFSAGGTVAALLFPIHFLVAGIAVPLGWLEAPSYQSVLDLAGHPLTRLYLFVLICLPLFHAAHRFRYTLYDGLKIKHLTILIVTVCYGTALVGTMAAAYFLLGRL